MFLNENYILASELIQNLGISIANISKLANQYNDCGNSSTIIKMGTCSFIHSTDKNLPKTIRRGLDDYNYTDMSNKLPCKWSLTEYNLRELDLINSNMITDKIVVGGKNLYVFDPEFVSKMDGKIGYVLNKAETMECLKSNRIDGYTELNKNKYFVWYSV
jgi:hypothetical protein